MKTIETILISRNKTEYETNWCMGHSLSKYFTWTMFISPWYSIMIMLVYLDCPNRWFGNYHIYTHNIPSFSYYIMKYQDITGVPMKSAWERTWPTGNKLPGAATPAGAVNGWKLLRRSWRSNNRLCMGFYGGSMGLYGGYTIYGFYGVSMGWYPTQNRDINHAWSSYKLVYKHHEVIRYTYHKYG